MTVNFSMVVVKLQGFVGGRGCSDDFGVDFGYLWSVETRVILCVYSRVKRVAFLLIAWKEKAREL